MAKIQLGKPPKTFPKDLSFPMLDGTVGTIKVTYTYRSRKEFAAFMDKILDAIKADGAAQITAKKAEIDGATDDAPALDFGLTETIVNERKAASQIDFIMATVEGWNLDVPFDREAVEQLVDELPLAAETIIRSYREAMTEGRLGN